MTSCGFDSTVSRDQWSDVFTDLYSRIARRCARTEVRERLRRYLLGLLERVERKNGWQLAEAIGDTDPQGVQRLLRVARWDTDGVRDDLRNYVLAHLGDDTSGVLIVDETGFLKKGRKSCGVARQYTGTAGDTVNAQVGVFLAYASDRGAAFIDRALYLPREWTTDQDRRAEAGIPKSARFATKITLAQRMLARAFDTAAPARWVVADSGYGRSHRFRQWLEKRGRSYAVMIPKTNAIYYCGGRERVEQLGARLTGEAWVSIAAGEGAQGERVHDWACLPLSDQCAKGMCRWLLVRRDPDDPQAHAYWLAYGPMQTRIEELVPVCNTRWQIEECFAQVKGEVGMDHYEVRTWEAWHRFITLCLLAHTLLVVLRTRALADQADDGKKGMKNPRSFRSLCRKRAAWCSHWTSPMHNAHSDSAGHAGAARTKRLLAAATPRAMRGHGANRRVIVRSSPMPWLKEHSPMPSGNGSDRCCRRSNRGRVGGGMTIARC